MIWNCEWKKKLLSISFKYSYFKPIFNYIIKGLWKGILIRQNCDTLMCFHLVVFSINIIFHLNYMFSFYIFLGMKFNIPFVMAYTSLIWYDLRLIEVCGGLYMIDFSLFQLCG
jgi:hypothetical protein